MSHENENGAVNEHATSKSGESCSFSLLRVACTVVVAMLVVVPAVLLLDKHGSLSARTNRAVAQGRLRSMVSQFNLDNATIPQAEILSGGPPKDGIPALSDPRMIPAKSATYLAPEDRVIGVALGNEARAYPLRILNYHEIVNDQINEQPIAVTYCPLCDSAAVFDRNTPGGVREFGVSGLLYNSNVLLYDRDEQAESLWSQLKSEAVTGPQVHHLLRCLPLELTTWNDWQSRHPVTTVLSDETGHGRNYSRSPYAGYFRSPNLMFPATPTNDRLPNKEKVLGVRSGGKSRAYPRSAFNAEKPRVEDQIDDKRLVIEFNPVADSLRVVEAADGVEWMYSFWFSWFAMHPTSEVYESGQ